MVNKQFPNLNSSKRVKSRFKHGVYLMNQWRRLLLLMAALLLGVSQEICWRSRLFVRTGTPRGDRWYGRARRLPRGRSVAGRGRCASRSDCDGGCRVCVEVSVVVVNDLELVLIVAWLPWRQKWDWSRNLFRVFQVRSRGGTRKRSGRVVIRWHGSGNRKKV